MMSGQVTIDNLLLPPTMRIMTAIKIAMSVIMLTMMIVVIMSLQVTIDNLLLPPTNNLMTALSRSPTITVMLYSVELMILFQNNFPIKTSKVNIVMCNPHFPDIKIITPDQS